MKLHHIVFVLLLFVGCATQQLSTQRLDQRHTEVKVFYGNAGGSLGLCYGFKQKPQEIVLKRGMSEGQARRVLIHELFHAAGYRKHSPGDIGMFIEYAVDWPIAPGDGFSEPERAAARRISRTFVLRPTAETRGLAIYAAMFWKIEVGREVFVVE